MNSHESKIQISFLLVNAIGEFQITDLNSEDSLCIETVSFQCFPFLGSFCRREVEYQRKKIMYNLSQHFAKMI